MNGSLLGGSAITTTHCIAMSGQSVSSRPWVESIKGIILDSRSFGAEIQQQWVKKRVGSSFACAGSIHHEALTSTTHSAAALQEITLTSMDRDRMVRN